MGVGLFCVRMRRECQPDIPDRIERSEQTEVVGNFSCKSVVLGLWRKSLFLGKGFMNFLGLV